MGFTLYLVQSSSKESAGNYNRKFDESWREWVMWWVNVLKRFLWIWCLASHQHYFDWGRLFQSLIVQVLERMTGQRELMCSWSGWIACCEFACSFEVLSGCNYGGGCRFLHVNSYDFDIRPYYSWEVLLGQFESNADVVQWNGWVLRASFLHNKGTFVGCFWNNKDAQMNDVTDIITKQVTVDLSRVTVDVGNPYSIQ